MYHSYIIAHKRNQNGVSLVGIYIRFCIYISLQTDVMYEFLCQNFSTTQI